MNQTEPAPLTEALCEAVIDWASRRVLSWKLSDTMDVSFCLEALDEALDKYGKLEIFNTDQGGQFTSVAFTDRLKQAGIAMSMDGKGRGPTTFSSNGSGAHPRTKRSIYTPTTRSAQLAAESTAISSSSTSDARTPA
jgi:transposase InsO family protein